MSLKLLKGNRGQGTVEYILMIAFGAVLSLQIVGFLNGVFQEGLNLMEVTVSKEMSSGQGFGPAGKTQ